LRGPGRVGVTSSPGATSRRFPKLTLAARRVNLCAQW